MRPLTRLQRIRASAEAGVTLTEVLMALVILGIIIAPLTAAMIIYLRNTDATVDRMSESHDAQIANAYVTYDVQNAGVSDWTTPPYTTYLPSIWLGQAVNASPYGCGSDTTTSLVRFAWVAPAAAIDAQQVRRAAYVVKPINATVGELHRVVCQGGAVVADVTLVHNVDLAQPPTVACPVDAASCTAATPPGSVVMAIGIRAPGSANTYTITLSGQRRQT